MFGCGSSKQTSQASTTTPPQAAGTCADPIELKGSTTLATESTKQGENAVSGEDPTCVGNLTGGAERVYKVVLPANGASKLGVKVTPEQVPGPDAFDPAIYATETCEVHPFCLTGSDDHGGGSLESIEYVNSSGQDRTIYVIVDGYEFQPGGGNFTLVSELSAP
jgi:hypothetical protein